MTVPVIYCEHLANDTGKPKCCTSCHDDHEAGYCDLGEIYDEAGKLTHVLCCTVAAWVECSRGNTQKCDVVLD